MADSDKTLSPEDAAKLQEQVKDLTKELKAVSKERDELKGSGDDGEDAKELKKQLSDLTKRMKTVEKERDELKNAGLSDQEKRDKEEADRKERDSALSKQNRELRVQLAASKLGIVDPEAASLLLDWDSVENPDDPKAVERALKGLVKDREWLVGDNSVDGGSGRKSPTPSDDIDSQIRQASGRVAA